MFFASATNESLPAIDLVETREPHLPDPRVFVVRFPKDSVTGLRRWKVTRLCNKRFGRIAKLNSDLDIRDTDCTVHTRDTARTATLFEVCPNYVTSLHNFHNLSLRVGFQLPPQRVLVQSTIASTCGSSFFRGAPATKCHARFRCYDA
jgi:hypothetical protein